MATPDLERQHSPPEEEYEEKEKRDSNHSSPRHSYEYARSSSPNRGQRRSLSRHASAVTTLSKLRSRPDPTGGKEFYHPLAQSKTGRDVLVDFEGKDDPYRPINWPFRKKAVTTLLYGMTTAGITFASSVYSSGLNQVAEEFNVGTEVSSLGIVSNYEETRTTRPL